MKKIVSDIEINSFLDSSKYILFNKKSKYFEVITKSDDKKISSEIKILVELLRYSEKSSQFHSKIDLRNIIFSYYDRCLYKYLDNYINKKEKIDHYDTCWINQAEKNIYIEKIEDKYLKDNFFTKKNIIDYLSSKKDDSTTIQNILSNTKIKKTLTITKSGWLMAKGTFPLTNSKITRLKRIFSKILHKLKIRTKKDRVVDIFYSIKAKGWDKKLAWLENGSVLGQFVDTNEYFSFTGRHRIAALALIQKFQKDKIEDVFLPIIKIHRKQIIGKEPYPGENGCYSCYFDS